MANTLEPTDIGEDRPLVVTFADDDGVLFDPATVTFECKNPVTDAVTTFTWTAAVPGTDIAKLSLGKFRAHIRPTSKGYWHWKWVGSGALVRIIQSTDDTCIPVRENVF